MRLAMGPFVLIFLIFPVTDPRKAAQPLLRPAFLCCAGWNSRASMCPGPAAAGRVGLMNRGKAKKLTAVARKLTLERFCNEDMLPANHSGTADPTDLSLPIDLE